MHSKIEYFNKLRTNYVNLVQLLQYSLGVKVANFSAHTSGI